MTASIQVVIDVICPWCFIGKRRIERLLADDSGASPRDIEWLPYELDADMPPGGAHRDSYRARRFGSIEISRAMDARASTAGREVGIDFRYERMSRTPNTHDAHRLIQLAGRYGLQGAVVEGLFRAYFLAGRDVGDSAVLLELARDAGLPATEAADLLSGSSHSDEVRALIERAKRSQVSVVPAVFVRGERLAGGIDSLEQILKGVLQ